MAKRITRSKTIKGNNWIIFATAVSGGILAYVDDLRKYLPWWVYIPLIVGCSAYNIYRRLQTTEAIEK